ncbi:MAG: methyltransferase domain-containing protein [Promethearchaeota archaeon]
MNTFNYNNIAMDYHNKRKKPWNALAEFLVKVKDKEILLSGLSLDLGCANGRNFELFNQFSDKIIGIDNSLEFLRIITRIKKSSQHPAKSTHKVHIVLADMRYVPIRSGVIDNVFSIASIHHIQCKETRYDLMLQIKGILHNDGKIILSVWRRWQKKFRYSFIREKLKNNYSSKRKKNQGDYLYEFGDKIVAWNVPNKNITYERFYHFFSRREFKRMLKSFEIIMVKKLGGKTNKDNFFTIARKREL